MTGKNNKMFWKAGLIFLAVFFVFFDGESALADIVSCDDIDKAKFRCDALALTSDHACVENRGDCKNWCAGYPGYGNPAVPLLSQCTETAYNPVTGKTNTNDSTSDFAGKPLDDGSWLLTPFKWLIYGMFKFCTWMLGLAAIIFGFIVEPSNVSLIMNNEGIYQSWAMVRDFLNLGFILVLLYIAFCVIFQIGSYSDSWKKMLLMMVIMALLVNFSYPICRIIVDVSNVAFYYILNVGFPGKGGDAIITYLTDKSGLATIIDAPNVSISYLIAITVFAFITAITFLVIACLFVVRTVAIGLLIIFSPIGFAGAAFPFSQKYAKDWWDNLFKYSFFAPIMIFMILIASKIMQYSADVNLAMFSKAKDNLGPNTDPNFFGTAAFFTIPIVILWFGMGLAQKLSIAGATTVTGMAEKTAKWAGKQSYKLPWKGIKATGIPGGIQQRWKSGVTDRFDRAQKSREARMAARFGDKAALERDMRTRASQYEKDQISPDDLKKLAEKGDSAAALALANQGKMDTKTLVAAMGRQKDERVRSAILGKTEETNMAATIDFKLKDNHSKHKTGDKDYVADHLAMAKKEFEGMTGEQWAKQKNIAEQMNGGALSVSDPSLDPHIVNDIVNASTKAFTKLAANAQFSALSKMNGKNAKAVENGTKRKVNTEGTEMETMP